MADRANVALNDLRDRVPLKTLVERTTELHPNEVHLQGVCPCCGEDQLHVNPRMGLFHCFGCRCGGDSIEWVKVTLGLDFPHAVEWLSSQYGVSA